MALQQIYHLMHRICNISNNNSLYIHYRRIKLHNNMLKLPHNVTIVQRNKIIVLLVVKISHIFTFYSQLFQYMLYEFSWLSPKFNSYNLFGSHQLMLHKQQKENSFQTQNKYTINVNFQGWTTGSMYIDQIGAFVSFQNLFFNFVKN